MPDANAYTVAWISALQTELVAAQVFLDEQHEKPTFRSHNDNTTYKFGSMKGHNVVIGILPNGEYGIATATAVARDIMRSFPNIRIGLLVGIGGGAPSAEHDIRLGDVVVSSPKHGHGGVIQYDYGKTIQDQEFKHTGFLNQAPTLLRSAITTIQADYEIDGHRLNKDIEDILTQKPRLRTRYGRPDHSSDLLFLSDVVHPNGVDCAVHCARNVSNITIRLDRTKGDDDLIIHYGNIASGNQLMKDARKRDKISHEHGILCFEMEAAGLVNHFPCLVIRGICDYADSHKNKNWQGYAAMTATSYAKDLLGRIPVSEVQNELRINEICDLVEIIKDDLRSTNEKVEAIKTTVERVADLEILNWLTPVDYGLQHSDNLKRAEPGTGKWLLNSIHYQEWYSGNRATLFCPGIPGAGKTVLTSIIIHDLDRHKTLNQGSNFGISYIYCNAQNKQNQSAGHLIASILKQLSEQQAVLPESVRELYMKHKKKRTRAAFDENLKALGSVLEQFDKTFILIDALDEFQDFVYGQSNFILVLLNLQRTRNVNIFVTSRPIKEIMDMFQGRPLLDIRAHDDDMSRYLTKEMSKLKRFVSRNLALQEEIKNMIIKSANGMFLLATLHIRSLYDVPTVNGIRSALVELKDTYDSIYRDIMRRITMQSPGDRDMAIKTLLWITCAERYLTISELQEALAIEDGKYEIEESNIADISDIVSSCAGLVIIDEKSNIVRLSHHTTQEFLRSTRNEWFPEAEITMSKACITYISFREFGTGPCHSDSSFKQRLEKNSLYGYICRYWIYHVCLISEILVHFIEFLHKDSHIESLIQGVMCINGSSLWQTGHRIEHPKGWKGLHLAAYFGWIEAIQYLIGHLEDLNITDDLGKVPLMWAAENGHDIIVEELLNTGHVNIDLSDDLNRTVFWFAAAGGHESVVDLLLGRVACQTTDDADLREALRVGNLGLGYLNRHQQKEDSDALENSIFYLQRTLTLIPKDHPSRMHWLTNLSTCYRYLHLEANKLRHIELANELLEEAMGLMKGDDPNRAILLNKLGAGYERDYLVNKRLGYFNNFAGVDKAISYYEMSVDLIQDDNPERGKLIEDLGSAHLLAYQHKGDKKHLERAFNLFQTSSSLRPDGCPERGRQLHQLGVMFTEKYRSTRAPKDLELAVECHQKAFDQPLLPLEERLKYGESLFALHFETETWVSAYEIAVETMRLLPPFLPPSCKRKHHFLGQISNWATITAAAALAAGKSVIDAIQILEQSRTYTLNIGFDIHLRISDLEKDYPFQAAQLADAIKKLEVILDGQQGLMQSTYQELYALIRNIRELPGFERFLQTAPKDELRSIATKGPIIFINTTAYRCDALIIERHRIWSLPLPDLSLSGIEARENDTIDFEVFEWLWNTTAKPILDALGFKSLPVFGKWPRVWWIPTGALCKFPIHAAGYHSKSSNDSSVHCKWPWVWWVPTGALCKFPIHAAEYHSEGSNDTVLDRVISSYTCSLAELNRDLQKASRAMAAAKPGKAIVFGSKSLPGASKEAAYVEDVCRNLRLQVIMSSSYREFKAVLKICEIFHFAGHAHTSRPEPLKSHLEYEGEQFSIAELMKLKLSTQRPVLAYLSGCRTGRAGPPGFTTSKNNPDNILHMVSAYQFAGFQNVIGTLAEIDDGSCMYVAAMTYQWMEKHGISDGSLSKALHYSIRALREKWLTEGAIRYGNYRASCGGLVGDYYGQKLDWAPYVHYGI